MCSAAARTAPPVPSATGCTASSTPSGRRPSSARAGPSTTTTRPAPASRAASTGQAIIGRPQISCSTFGVFERMRVPWPAARMTTVGAVTPRRLERRRRRRGLAPVGQHPLADRVVGHAVAAPDGGVARRLDLAHELLVGRAVDAARHSGAPASARAGRTAREQKRWRASRGRNTRRRAGSRVGRGAIVAPAMRVERRVAVRAERSAGSRAGCRRARR